MTSCCGCTCRESDCYRGRLLEGLEGGPPLSNSLGMSPPVASFMRLAGQGGLPPTPPLPHPHPPPHTPAAGGGVSGGTTSGDAATSSRSGRHRSQAGGSSPVTPTASAGATAAAAAAAADVAGSGAQASSSTTTGPVQLQQQAAAGEAEVPPCPDFSSLPEACWQQVLRCLPVRDLCAVARVCCALRGLAGCRQLWEGAHVALWGGPPPEAWSAATIKRSCRRSELRAARWLDARLERCTAGGYSSACLQVRKGEGGEGCRQDTKQQGRCTPPAGAPVSVE